MNALISTLEEYRKRLACNVACWKGVVKKANIKSTSSADHA